MTAPYTDCTTRIITWPIPGGLDEETAIMGIGQVCDKVTEKVQWLRTVRLFHDDAGVMRLEVTVTGKHQWMVHRRARSLAGKLVRRLGVMLSEPDVCRLPEHPNRSAASAAASRVRWHGGAGGSRTRTR